MSNKDQTTFGLVGVDGLKIVCVIGVNPDERVRQQELIVDFRVAVDFSLFVSEDTLDGAVDYTLLVKGAKEVAQQGHFQLIETLAWHILDYFFEHFGVPWAWVKVYKPLALGGEAIPVVELERGKKL